MRSVVGIAARGFVLALLAAWGWAPPASAQPAAQGAALTPVRVAVTPVAPWILAWIAKDKGFFAAHGLDVGFTEIQNISLLPGLVGSQLDIAVSTPPDLIKSAAGGLDVVAVAGASIELPTNMPTQLIVRGDSGIKTIADLKGKTIAAPTIGAVNHVATLYWLKKSGIAPGDVHGVEVAFPNMADQLKSGRVDAAEAVVPFVAVMLSDGGVSLGDPLLAVSSPARGTLWIAQGAWARAHAQVLAGWVGGMAEARDFMAKSPAETRTILAKYTRLPDPVVQKMVLPDYDPRIAAGDLDVWVKVLTDLGQLTETVDAAKLVVTSP